MSQQTDAEKQKRQILYPELRLVAYDANGKATPALCVTGDVMPHDAVESDGRKLYTFVKPLVDLLAAHIGVRMAGGSLALPESHNSHPAISIGRQLLAVCESGKAGYKCAVIDDAKIEGRKYLLVQVDKGVPKQ
jgi:hypothetical protein